MATSLNHCTFIGNLGRDPETRNTPSGAQVANFLIACTESWKDKSGQKQEKTEWVNCVAWNGLADIIQKYVKKGSKVFIAGKFATRSWEDKNGGGKRYATEITVNELIMLDGRGQGGGGGGGSSAGGFAGADDFSGPPAGVGVGTDDDLPF